MSNIQTCTPLWGVWEIESDIGEGSFGKVHKAVRKEFGRTYHCAIKHIDRYCNYCKRLKEIPSVRQNVYGYELLLFQALFYPVDRAAADNDVAVV